MTRSARLLVTGAAVLACAGPGAGVARAVTTTKNFTSPGVSSFTVPAGVSSISVTAIGAAGGSNVSFWVLQCRR